MTDQRGRLRRPLRWVLIAVLGLASPAAAHNTLLSSEPAAGAVVGEAPPQLLLRFEKPAPLNTASAEVIDSGGNRAKISGLTHGPGGDSEIVTPLPALPPGAVTLRWRLVGPDGHPLTGRIAFTVGGGDAGTAPTGQAQNEPEFEDAGQVPGPIRWLLRWGSYLAAVLLGGVLAAAAWFMPPSWQRPRVRTFALAAVAVIGVFAAIQLLLLAGVIAGTSPLSAWGSLDTALETTAGAAFAIRAVVAVVLGAVLTRTRLRDRVRWSTSAALFVALLGTWAFAGHSRSLRWPAIGVPLDVAHHAAAILWVGGLVVVARLALTNSTPEDLIGPVQRFARLAPIAVGALVITGVLQAIRLTGVPDLTPGSTHTRLLLVKLVVLALMLKVADINRRRVARRFRDPNRVGPKSVFALRRAMLVEVALGLIIIALTAAMVVSPPPIAEVAQVLSGP